MEIYIIANIKDNRNNLIGYRLIDIANEIQIKDVTKQQLIYVLKKKTLRVENAKYSNNRITGIYSALDKLDKLIWDTSKLQAINNSNSKTLSILKGIYKNDELLGCVLSDANGNVKTYDIDTVKKLMTTSKIVNAEICNRELVVKAKRCSIEDIKNKNIQSKIQRDRYITDEEAMDVNEVWDLEKFITYMNQHKYTFSIKDETGMEISHIPGAYKSRYDGKDEELSLEEIDKNCNIIHIPSKIKQVNLIFRTENERPRKIKTIIFGPDYYISDKNGVQESIIRSIQLNQHIAEKDIRIAEIETVWFQNKNNKRNINQNDRLMRNLTITKDYNLHIIEGQVKNLFNNCDLPYLIDIQEKIELNDSFNGCNILNTDKIITKNITDIFSSFNKSEITNLKISKDTEGIWSSFNEDYADHIKEFKNIDFSEATNLVNIVSSFNSSAYDILPYEKVKKSDNLINIDISQVSKLKKITRSFRNININYVILSDNIDEIAQSFVNIEIKQVKIPKNTKKVSLSSFNGGNNVDIEFESTESRALGGAYGLSSSDTSNGDIKVPEEYKEVCGSAFSSYRAKRIYGWQGIKKLSTSSFNRCGIDEIDLSGMIKIDKIPMYCFIDSIVKKIALSNSIKTIDEEAFKNCIQLSKLCIGDNVEKIEVNAFSKSQSDQAEVCEVYTVKESYAAKYFNRKKSRFIVKQFDNYKEAYNNYRGIATSSEAQQTKFRMLNAMSGDTPELLKEPYIKDCVQISKMLKTFENRFNKSDTKYSSLLIGLDLALPGIDIATIETFKNTVLNREDLHKMMQDKEISDISVGYTKDFVNYCKIISYLGKNQINLFNEDNISLWGILIAKNIQVCYYDPKCGIYSGILDGFANKRLGFVAIEINMRLVYFHLLDHSMLYTTYIMNLNSFLGKGIWAFGKELSENSVGDYIQAGDVISIYKDNKIHGIVLPNIERYKHIGKDTVLEKWILIGLNRAKNKVFNDNVLKDNWQLQFYDIGSDNIIEAKVDVDITEAGVDIGGESWVSDTISMNKITGLYRIKIMGIEKYSDKTLDKISKVSSWQDVRKMFNNTDLNNIYKMMLFNDKVDSKLRNLPGAYDNGELVNNKWLAKLAEACCKNKLVDTREMPEAMIKAIFESGLMERTNISLSKLSKQLDNPDVRTIKNSSSVLMMWTANNIITGYDKIYFYSILNMQTDDITHIYSSTMSIDSIVKNLCNLYGEPETELHDVNTEFINTDDFAFFDHISGITSASRVKLDIVIQKKTFEVFIVSNVWDQDYITLFRFRNYGDAKRALYEDLNDDTQDSYYRLVGMTWLDAKIRDDIATRRTYRINYNMHDVKRSPYDIYNIYIAVSSGLPNKYPLDTKNIEFFNLVAKQKKI